jgi:hypothetical protein
MPLSHCQVKKRERKPRDASEQGEFRNTNAGQGQEGQDDVPQRRARPARTNRRNRNQNSGGTGMPENDQNLNSYRQGQGFANQSFNTGNNFGDNAGQRPRNPRCVVFLSSFFLLFFF